MLKFVGFRYFSEAALISMTSLLSERCSAEEAEHQNLARLPHMHSTQKNRIENGAYSNFILSFYRKVDVKDSHKAQEFNKYGRLKSLCCLISDRKR